MKNTLFFLVLTVFYSLSVFGQTVSEEAKRYFDRGIAATEIAKSPEDYMSAIKEFEQAAKLAPDWPDVYYNLGMVQEKAEKYADAVISLKQYLQLVPDASDAEEVKSMINKLEFKAEQVLTPKDYTDIFFSLHDRSIWNEVGKESCPACYMFYFGWGERVGENLVKIQTVLRPDPNGGSPTKEYEVLKIDGNIIHYAWTFYECVPSRRESCRCDEKYIIEIVSRNLVKVRGTRSHYRASGGPVTFSYELRRK